MISRRLLPVLLLALLQSAQAHDDEHHGHGPAGHGEATVDASGPDAPAVSLALAPLPDGAVEARLDTRGFRFAEGHVDAAHVAGEGHAHLYIDGEKIARVFASRYRLPPLGRGSHLIEVGLYSNDHARYVVDGVPVTARAVLRIGRGGTGADAEPVRHAVHIRDGRVATPTLRVIQGQRVSLAWDSDRPAALHLHGYDIEAEVAPGRPVTMHFLAEIGGRFPVALHGDDAEGGHGHQALMYLEVYPD